MIINPYRFAGGGVTPVDPGAGNLVAHWAMDETSGSTMEDETGSHDGTYKNSPTLAASGVAGTAVGFNGTNEYSDASSSALLTTSGTGAFSISVWVYPTATSGNGSIITQYLGLLNNNRFYSYVIHGASTARVGTFWGNGGAFSTTSRNGTLTFPNNTWSHVVIVRDGASLNYYVDSVVQEITLDERPVLNTGNLIGARCTNTTTYNAVPLDSYYGGRFDEFRIYSDALTAAEVLYLYQNPGG